MCYWLFLAKQKPHISQHSIATKCSSIINDDVIIFVRQTVHYSMSRLMHCEQVLESFLTQSCNGPLFNASLNIFGVRHCHIKFCVNWFGGFGPVTPPNLAISIELVALTIA